MTGQIWFPGADTHTQNYADRWPGDHLPHPNVLLLHSMECEGWPTYDRGEGPGEVAPHFSYNCLASPAHRLRQHFPVNMSARALVNAPGGDETNTLNIVQIEISGTCDPGMKGKVQPFVPELGDDVIEDLAHLWLWTHDQWSVPLTALPRDRWRPYPESYGADNGTRMDQRAWMSFTGVCGHQHAVENEHGDPGQFPIARLLQRVRQLAGATADDGMEGAPRGHADIPLLADASTRIQQASQRHPQMPRLGALASSVRKFVLGV